MWLRARLAGPFIHVFDLSPNIVIIPVMFMFLKNMLKNNQVRAARFTSLFPEVPLYRLQNVNKWKPDKQGIYK